MKSTRYYLLVMFLLTAFNLSHAQSNGYNYDESKVPEYELPNPLVFLSGDTVQSGDEWKERRAEIYTMFENHVYGKTPNEKVDYSFQLNKSIPDFMDGKATLKEIDLIFNGNDSLRVTFLVIVPNQGQEPVPAFIAYNFRGNHAIHSCKEISLTQSWIENDRAKLSPDNKATEESRGCRSGRWPVERIVDRGYALVTCYYGDFDPDYYDEFKNGIFQLFDEDRDESSWGSIGAWSWGYSRMLDYLETDNRIDEKNVAVLGHSRLGKTALWAGAQDERFAMVISNESGCGGAALSNRKFGETVGRITHVFPHWFCAKYASYADQEELLPVDQHMLVSLIAPRPVYIASAEKDLWADPKGEFLAGLNANPVYHLLGTEGLPTNIMPTLNRPVHGQIGYHIRTGKHDLTNYDWEQYLDFADKHFMKR